MCQIKYINYLIINILGGIYILYTQSLPPIQSFPMEKYAAGNQNWMLTQGSNNQIYIANNEGVLSFDAERWKLYPTNSIVRSVAYFDDILYCPHHIDGVISGYCKPCSYRKPQPGMILHLLRKWKLDPLNCILFGDSKTDIDAGLAAGVSSFQFKGGNVLEFVKSHISFDD